jgi:hypothetical protein
MSCAAIISPAIPALLRSLIQAKGSQNDLCTMSRYRLAKESILWLFAAIGLVVRPFSPVVPYDIAVFRSGDREPSLVARALLDVLEARVAQLAAPRRGPHDAC